MTETTATPTATATVANKPPGRKAAELLLSAEGIESLKVQKYPMPVKAPRFPLGVNGHNVDAATTEFKDKKYTYFQYNGVGFWVTGHLNPELEYTFTFPTDYDFTPLNLDRKAVATKAAAAKKAKKEEQAVAGEESALASSEIEGEGEGSPEPAEARESPVIAPAKKGKKASR